MKRLIDVDTLLRQIDSPYTEYPVIIQIRRAIKEMIDNAPTVDAEPVRHGHWCVTQAYPHTVYCSECFQRFAQAHWAVWEDGSLPRDYCPHCGAKMDEVEE